MTTWQMVLAIAGLAITAFGVVIPLILGVIQLRKNYEWEKAMLATDLNKLWSEKTLPHRNIIEKKYGAYISNVKPIDPPDCEDFVGAVEGGEFFELKISVISLMNYFEDIAVLYTSGMADRSIVDATLRKPMTRYYDKIKPLSGCIDKVAGYPSWKPLDELITAWKQQDAKREAGIKPRRFP